MKLRMNTFLIFLLLLTVLPVGAKATNLGSTERVLTANDGLPTTATLSIAQTTDGFIWLGGYGGLTRYDGIDFTVVGGSRVSNVCSLLGTPDGSLWVSSMDCGLIRYQDNAFVFFRDLNPEQEIFTVQDMACSPDGLLYFASSNGIGYVDERNQIHWISVPAVMGRYFTSIACSKNGTVLCLSESGSVYVCKDRITKLPLEVGGDQLRCLDYDPISDRFYFGSEKNLVLSCNGDLEDLTRLKADGVTSINAFGFSADGQVFVCADDGVAVLQDGKSSAAKLKLDNSIEDVFADRDGNMWFASSRQGVLLVTQGRFRDVSLLAGLDSYVVNAIAYENGRLYIGHDNGYVILDETTYKRIDDRRYDYLKNKRIRDLYLDSSGRMWACTTGDGLYVRGANGRGWTHYKSADYPAIRSDKFRCVLETSIGIVAATDVGGCVITDDGVTNLAEGLNARILSLAEANGVIYAGTDGEGVYIIRDGLIQDHITTDHGLSSMRVMRLQLCSGNRGLWMSTGNNLDYLLFETGAVHHADSFPPVNVLDCLVMPDSSLWVLAGDGVYQTTESVVVDDGSAMSYRHYSARTVSPMT